jgi:hypothetical protein
MLEPTLPVVHGKKGPPLISEWQIRPWGELSQAKLRSNGCNLGLRLDNYLALDPDDEAAGQICDELEQSGVLPPTVSWQTWRGRTVRIYQLPQKKHLNAPIKPTASPMLELRLGPGQYVLMPPSYVKDTDSGQEGIYRYRQHFSPADMEPAELPEDALSKLIEIAKSGTKAIPSQKKTSQPSKLNFEKGSRDNSLFSVALTLRKGGFNRADIETTILQLAAACEPPVGQREALAKVESAFKETPGERNFKTEIEMWIEMQDGVFSSNDLDRDLGLASKNERAQRRINLKRLRDSGVIKRISEKSNMYCKIANDLQKIDFMNASPQNIYHVKWPFRLHKYVNLYPKNIVIVGGTTNAGKTAFLLNAAAMNCQDKQVRYLSSEMGPEELRNRLDLFELPLNYWQKIDFFDRSVDFSSVIDPTGFNIVDYLEMSDNFFQVGAEIKAIFDKLTTGIAVIAIQKKQGAEFARGGEFTMEKARLYITLDPGVLKIVKGKNWAQPGVNPNGMIFPYKLVQGCRFIDK